MENQKTESAPFEGGELHTAPKSSSWSYYTLEYDCEAGGFPRCHGPLGRPSSPPFPEKRQEGDALP